MFDPRLALIIFLSVLASNYFVIYLYRTLRFSLQAYKEAREIKRFKRVRAIILDNVYKS